MVTHTMRAFDVELQELSHRIVAMGDLAVRQVVDAIAALTKGDAHLAEHVSMGDDEIDRQQREIEETAVSTIARRQPMAIDLRELVGALRIVNDLERVGDLAENIAGEARILAGRDRPADLIRRFDDLVARILDQLRHVLNAYARHDVAEALAVWRADAEIDVLYSSLFAEICSQMKGSPDVIGPCMYLLLCAKNLERIGDHATNIAETVHYIVIGHVILEPRPKADTTCQSPPPLHA